MKKLLLILLSLLLISPAFAANSTDDVAGNYKYVSIDSDPGADYGVQAAAPKMTVVIDGAGSMTVTIKSYNPVGDDWSVVETYTAEDTVRIDNPNGVTYWVGVENGDWSSGAMDVLLFYGTKGVNF